MSKHEAQRSTWPRIAIGGFSLSAAMLVSGPASVAFADETNDGGSDPAPSQDSVQQDIATIEAGMAEANRKARAAMDSAQSLVTGVVPSAGTNAPDSRRLLFVQLPLGNPGDQAWTPTAIVTEPISRPNSNSRIAVNPDLLDGPRGDASRRRGALREIKKTLDLLQQTFRDGCITCR